MTFWRWAAASTVTQMRLHAHAHTHQYTMFIYVLQLPPTLPTCCVPSCCYLDPLSPYTHAHVHTHTHTHTHAQGCPAPHLCRTPSASVGWPTFPSSVKWNWLSGIALAPPTQKPPPGAYACLASSLEHIDIVRTFFDCFWDQSFEPDALKCPTLF